MHVRPKALLPPRAHNHLELLPKLPIQTFFQFSEKSTKVQRGPPKSIGFGESHGESWIRIDFQIACKLHTALVKGGGWTVCIKCGSLILTDAYAERRVRGCRAAVQREHLFQRADPDHRQSPQGLLHQPRQPAGKSGVHLAASDDAGDLLPQEQDGTGGGSCRVVAVSVGTRTSRNAGPGLRLPDRSPRQAERGPFPFQSPMVELAVAEGTIVTWRTDQTIPVGFGTIQVVPVWRFLLETEPRT